MKAKRMVREGSHIATDNSITKQNHVRASIKNCSTTLVPPPAIWCAWLFDFANLRSSKRILKSDGYRGTSPKIGHQRWSETLDTCSDSVPNVGINDTR